MKLGLRVAFDGIAVFLAAFFTGTNEKMVAMIPPILLILCGLILMFEAIERIRVAIEISEWSSLR